MFYKGSTSRHRDLGDIRRLSFPLHTHFFLWKLWSLFLLLCTCLCPVSCSITQEPRNPRSCYHTPMFVCNTRTFLLPPSIVSLCYEIISDSEERGLLLLLVLGKQGHTEKKDMALDTIAKYRCSQEVLYLAFYLNIYVELIYRTRTKGESFF